MEPWPIVWSGEGGASQWDERIVEVAVAAATTQLVALTGGRYGIETYDEDYRVPGGGGCLPAPYKGTDGQWRNGFSGGYCCQIRLDHAPVREILGVYVFGVQQAANTYAVERSNLRRRGSCWPTSGACDEPAVRVRYRGGLQPPLAGAIALGELAAEYAKGLSGSACRLPSGVVNVARQGVTTSFVAPDVLAQLQITGLPLTDAFINAVNPARLKGRSRVFSPDLPSRAR
jgi:hypothetical protein